MLTFAQKRRVNQLSLRLAGNQTGYKLQAYEYKNNRPTNYYVFFQLYKLCFALFVDIVRRTQFA